MSDQIEIVLLDDSRSIAYRCKRIQKFFKEMLEGRRDKQLLKSFFPFLLKIIFINTNNKNGWIFSNKMSSEDEEELLSLLSPLGYMFQIMLHLSVREERFPWPFQYLPAYTRHLLSNGYPSMDFYQNIPSDMHYLTLHPNSIQLYMFYFAHGATLEPKVEVQKKAPEKTGNSPWNMGFQVPNSASSKNKQDNLYERLLKIYLDYFFPVLDGEKNTFHGNDGLDIVFLETIQDYYLNQNCFELLENELYVEPTIQSIKAASTVIKHLLSGIPWLRFQEPTYGNSYTQQTHLLTILNSLYIKNPLYQFLYCAFSKLSGFITLTIPLREIVDLWILYIVPWENNEKPRSLPNTQNTQASPLRHMHNLIYGAGNDGTNAEAKKGKSQAFFREVVEEYIAHNGHFFCPLLKLFIVRATVHCQTENYLSIVKNVLNVFDEELVGCIRRAIPRNEKYSWEQCFDDECA
eukprot:TRINITY_DN7551_c0_g1_i2.p1 TRINITY_DN7551_c0_g1~~TRINITY_DN7551_c0_g1_i2.p1  ORF type:complete len:461 (-),score=71.83 TRINITY_DN7551_c0_g1_i2:461-1843(-)